MPSHEVFVSLYRLGNFYGYIPDPSACGDLVTIGGVRWENINHGREARPLLEHGGSPTVKVNLDLQDREDVCLIDYDYSITHNCQNCDIFENGQNDQHHTCMVPVEYQTQEVQKLIDETPPAVSKNGAKPELTVSWDSQYSECIEGLPVKPTILDQPGIEYVASNGRHVYVDIGVSTYCKPLGDIGGKSSTAIVGPKEQRIQAEPVIVKRGGEPVECVTTHKYYCLMGYKYVTTHTCADCARFQDGNGTGTKTYTCKISAAAQLSTMPNNTFYNLEPSEIEVPWLDRKKRGPQDFDEVLDRKRRGEPQDFGEVLDRKKGGEPQDFDEVLDRKKRDPQDFDEVLDRKQREPQDFGEVLDRKKREPQDFGEVLDRKKGEEPQDVDEVLDRKKRGPQDFGEVLDRKKRELHDLDEVLDRKKRGEGCGLHVVRSWQGPAPVEPVITSEILSWYPIPSPCAAPDPNPKVCKFPKDPHATWLNTRFGGYKSQINPGDYGIKLCRVDLGYTFRGNDGMPFMMYVCQCDGVLNSTGVNWEGLQERFDFHIPGGYDIKDHDPDNVKGRLQSPEFGKTIPNCESLLEGSSASDSDSSAPLF